MVYLCLFWEAFRLSWNPFSSIFPFVSCCNADVPASSLLWYLLMARDWFPVALVVATSLKMYFNWYLSVCLESELDYAILLFFYWEQLFFPQVIKEAFNLVILSRIILFASPFTQSCSFMRTDSISLTIENFMTISDLLALGFFLFIRVISS